MKDGGSALAKGGLHRCGRDDYPKRERRKRMNFIRFDDLMVNLERVTAVKIRRNTNDGSFRNKKDYPYAAELYGGGKPFTVHLTEKMMEEFNRQIVPKDLNGERG
jgi:hypothetical protein